MSESKVPALLFFLIGNYFFTFLIIGFLAAGISLLNKPKPLRIDTVVEAFFSYYLLFTIGMNNLINFVFHVFFGDIAAKFIGWENSPFQAEVGFASLGVGNCGSHCVQGEPAVSIRDAHSAISVLTGRGRRAHLPDDRGEEFLAGKCRTGSSK